MPIPPDLTPFLHAAREAAIAAGQLLTDFAANLADKEIRSKSNAVDLVSDADESAQHLIQDKLHAALPDAGFIGEEGVQHTERRGLNWVVDPLDGTSNFLSGVPFWAVSIALTDAELQPLVGVVHAPALRRLWSAAKGAGCLADDRPCSVRPVPPGGGMENAMLATGFPYAVASGSADINISNFVRMQGHFHKIRRIGSAAIDLAYLAEGIFDGMWELMLQPWDTAAGILLVSEAGGIFSRFNGSQYRPGDEDLIAASTEQLLKRMREQLKFESASS
jgi:myo-inositol-1(or 4)-monophosphatase